MRTFHYKKTPPLEGFFIFPLGYHQHYIYHKDPQTIPHDHIQYKCKCRSHHLEKLSFL